MERLRAIFLHKQISDICPADNFSGTFPHFRFIIITKKELARLLIMSVNSYAATLSFKCHCQCASLLLKKKLGHSQYQLTFRVAFSKE